MCVYVDKFDFCMTTSSLTAFGGSPRCAAHPRCAAQSTMLLAFLLTPCTHDHDWLKKLQTPSIPHTHGSVGKKDM